MTDYDSKYDEVRNEVYLPLVNQLNTMRHWLDDPDEFTPPLNVDTGPSKESFLLGYRKAHLEISTDLEDLLNKWDDEQE